MIIVNNDGIGRRVDYAYCRTPDSHEATIRVGSRSNREAGPNRSAEWMRASRRGEFFQEVRSTLYSSATVRVHGDIEVQVHMGTWEHLEILDRTFPLIPPEHLQHMVDDKPQGLWLVDRAGIGGSASYMGGLNAMVDDPSTALFDETQAIQITYGAMWERRDLGICPTAYHELGHVMQGHGLTLRTVAPEVLSELAGGSQPSRNPASSGGGEALCNAYMYLTCYSSEDSDIHSFGARPPSTQRSPRVRDALRRSPAFTGLTPDWQNRFRER